MSGHDLVRAWYEDPTEAAAPAVAPGRKTLTQSIAPRAARASAPTAGVVMRKTTPDAASERELLDASGRPDLFTPPDPFEAATRGSGGEVPHRAALARSFGDDFSDVRAYTGRDEALAAMGARAATDGTRVAFADASPSAEVVAHELAHVAQHRRAPGGVQPKGYAPIDHPAEREADDVAARAVAGERVAVVERPSGALHRLAEARRLVIVAACDEITIALQTPADADGPLRDHDRRLAAYQAELRDDATGVATLARVEAVLKAVRKARMPFAAVVPVARGGERVVEEHDDDSGQSFILDAGANVHRGRQADGGQLLGTGAAPIETNAMVHGFQDPAGVGDCHFVQFVCQSTSYVAGGRTYWDDGQVDVANRAAPMRQSRPGAAHWVVDAPDGGTPFYDDNSLSRRTPTALYVMDKPRTSFTRLNEIVDDHPDLAITSMEVGWTFCTVLVRRNEAGVFAPVVVTNWRAIVPVAMHAGWAVPGDLEYADGEVMGGGGGWNELQTALLSQYPNSQALFGIASTAAPPAAANNAAAKVDD